MMNMTRTVMLAALAGVVACGAARGEDAAAPAGGQGAAPAVTTADGTESEPKTAEDGKKQLSRLRGKLLYKKGQIRRIEKATVDKNEALSAKTADLERQRREAYVAVEPKLAALYEEQDALDTQVQEASDALKK